MVEKGVAEIMVLESCCISMYELKCLFPMPCHHLM